MRLNASDRHPSLGPAQVCLTNTRSTALFPALAAIISLWALAFDAHEIERQINSVSSVLPEQAAKIIKTQVKKVASGAGAGVTLAAIGGILCALFRALAPDIVTAIINGQHPPQLSAKRLIRLALKLPTDWAEQRKLLGF